MKTIEYRAKEIINNKWVFGYYSQAGINSELKGVIMPKGEAITKLHEVDTKTVCELIGFINNTKIFSKDILKSKLSFENSDVHHYVFIDWDEHSISYVLKTINGLTDPPLNWISSFEKVGNIFDNPELLKLK